MSTKENETMAFGDNYRPVYEAPTLADGIYKAQILKSELGNFPSGDEYVKVTVQIAGKAGYNPNTIWLSSTPALGAMKANGNPVTQDDIDRNNRQLTTFFLCFGIKEGDFDFSHWKGMTGTVKVAPQYDKNEPDKKSKQFKQIWPMKPESVAGSIPEVKEQPKAQPTPSATATPDAFPEDILF